MAPERRAHRAPLLRAWTPKEDAVLLDMLHQGKPLGSIAVKLKRSTSAIYHRKVMLESGDVSPEPKR